MKGRSSAPWTLGRVPNGYWDSADHRVTYLHWLGRELGYRRPVDWYQLRERHFLLTGGGGLFGKYYKHLPLNAARERYPNSKWDPARFRLSQTAKPDLNLAT